MFSLRVAKCVQGCLLVCVAASLCYAQQDPLSIRAGSGRVIVPVAWFGVVKCPVPGKFNGCLWDDEIAGVPVVTLDVQRDSTPLSLGILSAGKIKLFEDGEQQQIESFHVVAPSDIRVWLDNLGAHTEAALGPNGIWSTADYVAGSLRAARSSHLFLISYSPPQSRDGGCHTIGLKGPHESHLIYSKEYCRIPSPPADSLRGTPEDSKLEGYLVSGKQGSIHPKVQATAFYGTPGEARINIDIDFPFNEVKPPSWKDGTLATSLLIIAYTKSGQVAGRISEQVPADRVFSSLNDLESLKDAAEVTTSTRYDAQMELPPGEYKLALVYEHGKDFGTAEVPLKVDNLYASQFAISSIAICKRVRDAGAVPVATKYVPLVAGKYEFTPAGDTVFREGDSLMAYFELYEPSTKQPPPYLHVSYTMTIRNAQTDAVALQTTESADSWIQPGKSTVPVAAEPVMSKLNLAPGRYQFEIQATDSAGRSTSVANSEFSIE